MADSGTHHLAAPDTLQAPAFHQPLDGAARYRDALAPHLLSHLVGTVDPHIRLPDPLDLRIGVSSTLARVQRKSGLRFWAA